jgi:hypothetical protein
LREILRQMPIWYHREADTKIRRAAHSQRAICLRKTHHISTVGETEALAKVSEEQNHKRRKNCRCRACNRIRAQTGCDNPHGCAMKAKELLDMLPRKWDPRGDKLEDHEPSDFKMQNEDGSLNFNWRLTTHGNLAEMFRIFTEEYDHNNTVWIPKKDSTNEWITIAVEAYWVDVALDQDT